MIDQAAFADLQEGLWIVFGPSLQFALVILVTEFVGFVVLDITLALLRRMMNP